MSLFFSYLFLTTILSLPFMSSLNPETFPLPVFLYIFSKRGDTFLKIFCLLFAD